ncbi:MAG: hypothetical protein ACK5NG_01925 [Chthoniobacterales bacterium]
MTTQPNYRQVQFGIDDAHVDDNWQDCGRPGQAIKIASLAAVNGNLYAGTTAADQAGHLWQYGGG